MNKINRLLLPLVSAAGLVSCATPEYDPGVNPVRPHVPAVTLPADLNRDEQALIGEVERTLQQNGLRPTDRPDVEYQLAFSVEDGPVNADVTLDLYQGRNRVAHAYARVGGPRIVFQRQRVIREAFDKALRQFEAQLPRTGSYQEPAYRDGGPQQPGPYDDGGAAPYGTPNPYGQQNDWQQGGY